MRSLRIEGSEYRRFVQWSSRVEAENGWLVGQRRNGYTSDVRERRFAGSAKRYRRRHMRVLPLQNVKEGAACCCVVDRRIGGRSQRGGKRGLTVDQFACVIRCGMDGRD